GTARAGACGAGVDRGRRRRRCARERPRGRRRGPATRPLDQLIVRSEPPAALAITARSRVSPVDPGKATDETAPEGVNVGAEGEEPGVRCGACGAPTRPSARFCDQCGTPLDATG